MAVGPGNGHLDPRSPHTVYSAGLFGVFRSADAGRHWTPFSEGLGNVSVETLAVAPNGHTILAGSDGAGVFDYHFAGSHAAGGAPSADN